MKADATVTYKRSDKASAMNNTVRKELPLPFLFPMRFSIRIRFALRSRMKRAGTAALPHNSITPCESLP